MDICRCGKDLSKMKKNPHNLNQHLKKCNNDGSVNIKLTPISNFFSKQSNLKINEN